MKSINSVEEFVRLLESPDYATQESAVLLPISDEAWQQILRSDAWIRQAGADNKTVRSDRLLDLVHDPDVRVRRAVCNRRAADARVLSLLVHDVCDSIRVGVAGNPRTPDHILQILLNDSWEEIRVRARRQLSSRGIEM